MGARRVRRRGRLWVSLACLVGVVALVGIGYAIQASSNRLQMGDPMWDEMLESSGATYSLPTGEVTSLTEDQAIRLASEEAPDLAAKATGVVARFLIYNSPQEGCEQRPIWLVTFDGVVRSASGGPAGRSTPREVPRPVQFSNVALDALTGDVIFLESYGHRRTALRGDVR